MPDSGAVYQPTTVGYSYDTGVGGFLGVSVSRPKISLKKLLEWAVFAVAIAIWIAALLLIIIDVATSGYPETDTDQDDKSIIECDDGNATNPTDQGSDPFLVHKDQDGGYNSRGSTITAAYTLFAVGLILNLIYLWLRFIRMKEEARNEPTGGGGQYGPVLTEVPSHPKAKQAALNHQVTASALSDQEEETRTLMQEPATFNPNGNNAQENQHPG